MNPNVVQTALRSVAMARGTVVIDANLRDLAPILKDMNMHVKLPRQGMKDREIAEEHSNRILITNNSKDFIKYAPRYDLGIIATEAIKSKDALTLSDIVSDAISKYSLWSKRHGFILRLQENGRHQFEELTQ